ncbi:MAG: Brp/Blh family beta-carotene 15,15'-dioxygenase [Ornithinibacter sp.]
MSLLRSTPVPHRGRGCAAPVALRDVRVFTLLPIAAAFVILLVSIALPAAAMAIALPVAILGAILGVPHGAVDHLVPGWLGLDGRSVRRRGRHPARVRHVRFLSAYVAAALAGTVSLLFAPTPTLLAFLVLSAAHFGWGEVVTSAERSGRATFLGAGSVLIATANGLVTVGLLVWRNPSVTDAYVRALSPTVAEGSIVTASAGVLGTLAVVTAALVVLLRRRRLLEAGELVLLTSVFMFCPPLAAFGVYFGLWHAVRHSGRLLDLLRADEAGSGVPDRGWGSSFARLARLSSAPTAAALLAVLVLVALRGVTTLSAEVSVLLAVTFPHAGVVARLDVARSRRVSSLRASSPPSDTLGLRGLAPGGSTAAAARATTR